MSMTGFGKAVALSGSKKISVEIKSLNSKQLDINVRLPHSFHEHELELRSRIGKVLERGKVDVLVSVDVLPDATVTPATNLNLDVLAAYVSEIKIASEKLGIPEPEDWYSVLLRFPDTIRTDSSETADESETAALFEAADGAVAALMAHRRTEGEALEKFFTLRIERISELLASIDPYEKERVLKVRQRLEEGLAKIPAVEIDKGRLEAELIFYIEKLDVNEEKQRLAKHLTYFLETQALPHPGQGKKLGFIAQEMGREINTLGSKSNHAEMQAIVVRMKDALEQIKEQVLNVM